MGPIRVALVNDQPLFARGLAMLLPAVTDSRVTIVATTNDGSLASALIRQHRPDVALVDLAIPAPGGLRTIAAINRTAPDVPVIAMSDRGPCDSTSQQPSGLGRTSSAPATAADSEEAIEALTAGAIGYLCKTSQPEDLVMPLVAAVDGWAVVPRAVVEKLLASRAMHPVPLLLAPHERQLWRMIARGRSVDQIAAELHVSDRTAKRLTASLLRRLKVKNRIEAATLAGKTGLLDTA